MKIYYFSGFFMVHKLTSTLQYFFKSLLLYSWSLCIQTKYRVKMRKEASFKILNFMTSGAMVPVLRHGHFGNTVKMHSYFFLNLLLYSQTRSTHTEYVVMMNIMDVIYMYYQNCKFHDTPVHGFLSLGTVILVM